MTVSRPTFSLFKRLCSFLGFCLIGLSWLWISGFVLFLAYVTLATPQEPDARTDAIIVLTGGQNRIHTGLSLLTQGKADYLFISGVNPGVTIEQIVNQWDPNADIPCCIILDHAAENTEQNARESGTWIRSMRIDSVRLVTSSYHLPRALMEFHHAMPRHTMITHPIKSPVMEDGSRDFLRLGLSEYNKTLMAWVRQNVFDPTLLRMQLIADGYKNEND